MTEKRIKLALQGGGSHGAFTWGVLERLLEDGRIGIDAVSGASAGAINAAVLAQGITTGGREGGLRALEAFWQGLIRAAPAAGWAPAEDPATSRNHPAVDALLFLSRFLSPGQINPFNLNLLRDILAAQIDFDALRNSPVRLFLAATQVATGRARIFSNDALSLEVLLASACLPTFNPPVEIDGEGYWDGGLTANPPLRPLLYHAGSADLVLVAINPRRREGAPATAENIRHRLAEISFSAAAASELQGIVLAKQEAGRSWLPLGRLDRRLRRLKLHMIDADDFMRRLDVTSRFNTDAAFIAALRDEGRSRAETWLQRNFRHLGSRSSLAFAEHLA